LARSLSFELDPEEGAYLVGLARSSIEAALEGGEAPNLEDVPGKLRTDCGVFVTLNNVSGSHHSLRGCIGFPYPVMPLVEAVREAAVSAATRDPRFQPVSLEEMGSVSLEVSVLTPPEKITVDSPGEYSDHVLVGRDGLIVERGSNKGLLLPQVAVDWGWDTEEFLTQCCIKAYLPPDAWLTPGTEVSVFRAIIFAEKEPRGRVERVELKGTG
jgi:uncharacterized protein (TIGR00296 family)